MVCTLCHIRKARRFCPGVNADICTICCGTEREVTVDCPLDCPYLQEAHKHERTAVPAPPELPNKDISVTDEFIENHERLLTATGSTLLHAALDTPGAADRDARDALDALIRTHRTLQSGVYYETRPVNTLANRIYSLMQEGLEGYRKNEREETGLSTTRDTDVLRALVFLQRVALDRDNGRPRGRAFLGFLHSFFGDGEAAPPRASSLIVP
jgi:hypothetical protein